jgi:uncharacterized protein YaaR (DUF327 family)
MKVRESRTNEGKINTGNKGKEAEKIKSNDAKRFGDYVSANLRSLSIGELKQLLDEVDEYGGKLEAKFTLDCLLRYKDAVSRFLTKAVSNMFEFKKHDYYHNGSGRDVFAVVKKVNSKLEEVTCVFLSEQNDRLSILTIIGEIRGMLLDLSM